MERPPEEPVKGSVSAKSSFLGGVLACLVAFPLSLYLWGFSVDDALIPTRVAAHVLDGLGPRFNAGGPVTDAVTPLGFAEWLAALGAVWGAESNLELFQVARWSGLGAALASVVVLGSDLAHGRGRWGRLVAFGALGTCVPLAAWAGAGLETPWVMLLATWAQRNRRGAELAAGLAAALRPELVPWSVALLVVRGTCGAEASERWRRAARGAAWALGPAAVVATIRWISFGVAVPLSSIAKEPDFAHGCAYALGGVLRSGPFWLLAAPWCVARVVRGTGEDERRVELLAVLGASGAHVVALVLAGGDWMAFFRLFVPILPATLWAGAELDFWGKGRWRAPARALRLTLAVACGALLVAEWGADARRVVSRRLDLIERAKPALASARRVAAVDVGWVGAATTADVVDLAGVTDPRIAALTGGHTTKRVSAGLLAARDVDTLVFLVEWSAPSDRWSDARFRYGVEARLAYRAEEMGYRLVERLSLAGTPWHYVVCRLP